MFERRTYDRVLITGASRGIGRAVAKALNSLGYWVVGTSRDPGKIEDRIEGVEYIKLDLNDDNSIAECARSVGAVDILINNAGQSQIGPAEELPLKKIRRNFQVNLFGMIQLTQAFLPGMRKRGKGFVINIGSLAGKFAVPFQSSYVASKFALAGFSWTLRNEVMKYGIKVVVIEPGDIRTTLLPDLIVKDDSAYKDSVLKVKTSRDKKVYSGTSPEAIAEKVVKILRTNNPKPFYTVGGKGPLFVFLKRFLSDRFVEKLVRLRYGLS